MKTIMDAVNELRGDLNTRERTSSCNQVIVALSSFEGYEMGHIDVGSGNRNNNSIYWGVICTFDQFRNCVKGCINNFGLPSVTTIDWSKAPEYYDYFLVNKLDSTSNGFCHKLSNGRFSFEDGSVTSHNEAFNIHHKPINPIYTHAMLNDGVYPVAGMKCLFTNRTDAHPNYEECIIEYIGDLYCVVILEGNRQGCSRIANYAFKPIDNRTPKEKAIDEFMAENLKGGIAFKHLISLAYDKWVK